jgi:hypothetical protein
MLKIGQVICFLVLLTLVATARLQRKMQKASFNERDLLDYLLQKRTDTCISEYDDCNYDPDHVTTCAVLNSRRRPCSLSSECCSGYCCNFGYCASSDGYCG